MATLPFGIGSFPFQHIKINMFQICAKRDVDHWHIAPRLEVAKFDLPLEESQQLALESWVGWSGESLCLYTMVGNLNHISQVARLASSHKLGSTSSST